MTAVHSWTFGRILFACIPYILTLAYYVTLAWRTLDMIFRRPFSSAFLKFFCAARMLTSGTLPVLISASVLPRKCRVLAQYHNLVGLSVWDVGRKRRAHDVLPHTLLWHYGNVER